MTERTEEELTEIARQLYRGEIFTSIQVNPSDEHLLPMIFMPLGFADDELREKIASEKPAIVFGYLKDALPRGINGYPFLPSCSFLSEEEWEVVYAKFEKIKTAMESI